MIMSVFELPMTVIADFILMSDDRAKRSRTA